MRTAFCVLLALMILQGCASTRPHPVIDAELPAGFPYHTVDQIQQNIILTSDTLLSYRGKASFSVSSPEQSGRFNAEIKNRRGDSLYMSISPGLGIEAARVLVTADSIFFYDRIKNQLTYGSIADAAKLLSIPVTSDDLFRNLLGIVVPEADLEWEIHADSAFYYLRNLDDTRLYVVDPALWRVVRYQERDAAGELVEERVFSDFDIFDGVYLPRRVFFRRPGHDAVASLYYRDLNLNPEELSFGLNIRDSTKRVLVN